MYQTYEGSKRMTYKVGLIQFAPKIRDNNYNRNHSVKLIKMAIDKNADLIILPELANSGLIFSNQEDAYDCSETLEGETATQWKNLAMENKVYIVAGFNERVGSECYNSALLIGPDGIIDTYRKVHLVGWVEGEYFEQTSELPKMYELPFVKIGIQICYDVWFPEMSRWHALQGAELICVPSNWFATPDGVSYDNHGLAAPHYLMKSSSIANNLAFANASRIGTEDETEYIGGSCVINNNGQILDGLASEFEEEVKIVTMSIEKEITRYYFNDLRKDLYKKIYSGN